MGEYQRRLMMGQYQAHNTSGFSGDYRAVAVDASGELKIQVEATAEISGQSIRVASGEITVLSGSEIKVIEGGIQVSGDVGISGTVQITSGVIEIASGLGVVVESGIGVVGDFTVQSGLGVVVQSGLNVVIESGNVAGGGQVSGDVGISGTVQITSGVVEVASGLGVVVQSGVHVVSESGTVHTVVDIGNIRTGMATAMSTTIYNVTATSGGEQIAATNWDRESLIIQNIGTADIHIKEISLQSGEGLKVAPDGSWNSETYRGALYGIANSSGNKVCVQEEIL